jgi:hypothetical protein
MAKRTIINSAIPSIDTEWDDGTNAYSGKAVEDFIKSQLSSKIGYLVIPQEKDSDGEYHVWGFASESAYKSYSADTKGKASLRLLNVAVPSIKDAVTSANEAASTALNSANSANIAAGNAATQADAASSAASLANTAIEEVNAAKEETVSATELCKQLIEQASQVTELGLYPTAMTVEAPTDITLGNLVTLYVKAKLQPEYAIPNILYLGDNNAVSVAPDGRVSVLKEGVSVVHVVPTGNTALFKTIEIRVRLAGLALVNSRSAVMLTSDGSLLLN